MAGYSAITLPGKGSKPNKKKRKSGKKSKSSGAAAAFRKGLGY